MRGQIFLFARPSLPCITGLQVHGQSRWRKEVKQDIDSNQAESEMVV